MRGSQWPSCGRRNGRVLPRAEADLHSWTRERAAGQKRSLFNRERRRRLPATTLADGILNISHSWPRVAAGYQALRGTPPWALVGWLMHSHFLLAVVLAVPMTAFGASGVHD